MKSYQQAKIDNCWKLINATIKEELKTFLQHFLLSTLCSLLIKSWLQNVFTGKYFHD